MLAGMGYGTGAWGGLAWGGGGGTLSLLSALAIRENVVRLTFSQAVKFSRLLDPGDSSDPELYTVAAVAGTVGMDGEPVREVRTANVERNKLDTSQIDITTDRPFSAFPALYTVEVGNIHAESGGSLDPDTAVIEFYALARAIIPNRPQFAVPRRDIASPNDLQALLDPLPSLDQAQLGVFAIDSSGDYAADEGVTSYRKRIFRRLFTKKNGFAHLAGYGVGVLEFVKQLGRSKTQQEIAADAEAQIFEEPETVAASVTFVSDPLEPHLMRMVVRARSKTGETIDEPVSLDIGG